MATKKIKLGLHYEIGLRCDYCSKEFNTKISDFKEAMYFARRYGWIIVKKGEKWKHYCSQGCVK